MARSGENGMIHRWLLLAALALPACGPCGGSASGDGDGSGAADETAGSAEAAATAPASGAGTEATPPADREPQAPVQASRSGQPLPVNIEVAGGGELPEGWRPAGNDDPRAAVASAARQDLAMRLQTRLINAMTADGPASAVDVCSQEAGEIAEDVAKDHGVEIGRTSDRLRNGGNAPPSWAAPIVERRPARPLALVSEAGAYAELAPIRVGEACLACHGDADSLRPDVRAALAERYPDDHATGYADGDLRGWFWVYVPQS